MKTYTRSPFVPLITDSTLKPYVLTVRDLPLEQKPREKIINHGPVSASMAELLAVILNVGTKKEEILTMTSRIVKEYGERFSRIWIYQHGGGSQDVLQFSKCLRAFIGPIPGDLASETS